MDPGDHSPAFLRGRQRTDFSFTACNLGISFALGISFLSVPLLWIYQLGSRHFRRITSSVDLRSVDFLYVIIEFASDSSLVPVGFMISHEKTRSAKREKNSRLEETK